MNIKTGLHTRMKAGFLSFMSINGSHRQKVIKKFVVLHLKQTVKFGDNAVFHDAFTYFLALRKYKDYNQIIDCNLKGVDYYVRQTN